LKVLETERLLLRHATTDDAEFILELVNDPAWLQFIGDKNVHTMEDARAYVSNRFTAVYRQFGFGSFLTELKENGSPIGICGLTKKDGLESVDLGFALLPEFRGKGYGFEAALAVMDYATNVVGLKELVALTSPANRVAAKLLEKLGFCFEKMVRLTPEGPKLRLFALARTRSS